MAGASDDELGKLLSAWRAGTRSEALFVALRDPMRQAARRGIRKLLPRQPDEADVDDVVLRAFRELLERESTARSPVGLACAIAERRGMDKARGLIREQKRLERLESELLPVDIAPDDEDAAARRNQLRQYAVECLARLTGPQREAIEATVQRQESLSDWVAGRGTSYEAGRRMIIRALKSLRRCVATKAKDDEKEEG